MEFGALSVVSILLPVICFSPDWQPATGNWQLATGNYKNMRQIVQTDQAPAPVGPYNQAIIHNGTLYVSGQIAINPANGELVTENIEAETHQVMKNLAAVLDAGGASFADVLKCTIFVSDMKNYGRINAVYSEYFNDEIAPARELVEVANLPKYVNIEISVIAAV